eukprot:250089-Hanusia_phi.AAC.8
MQAAVSWAWQSGEAFLSTGREEAEEQQTEKPTHGEVMRAKETAMKRREQKRTRQEGGRGRRGRGRREGEAKLRQVLVLSCTSCHHDHREIAEAANNSYNLIYCPYLRGLKRACCASLALGLQLSLQLRADLSSSARHVQLPSELKGRRAEGAGNPRNKESPRPSSARSRARLQLDSDC